MPEGFEITVVSGAILSLLTAWGFRLYIRYGRYEMTPVMDGDSCGWFEVPWWLRWPVIIASGFAVASGFAYVLAKYFGIEPFTFMLWESGPLSLVLTLALFLAELNPGIIGRRARRLIVYSVAFCLGGTSSMLIYGLAYKLSDKQG